MIPVLLLGDGGLVKTERFRSPRYVGDPINAVRIFNELRADEVVFLDIFATPQGRTVSAEFVRRVGEEADMPFAVGGGVRSVEAVRELLAAGAEKVVLGTVAVEHPSFVAEVAQAFGSSTVVVCLDVKRDLWGRRWVWSRRASRRSIYPPDEFALTMERMGAGELIVHAVEREGTMKGYDLELLRQVSRSVTIPVVALGGAGRMSDFGEAVGKAGATAVAAGSLFVFHGPHRGVLISYPERTELPF